MAKLRQYFCKNWKTLLTIAIGLVFLFYSYLIVQLKILVSSVWVRMEEDAILMVAIEARACIVGVVIGLVVNFVLLKFVKGSPKLLFVLSMIASLLWIIIMEPMIASALLGYCSVTMLMLIPFLHNLVPMEKATT